MPDLRLALPEGMNPGIQVVGARILCLVEDLSVCRDTYPIKAHSGTAGTASD